MVIFAGDAVLPSGDHSLKLKCDKKIPCGSCVRRGCTTICPNGSLSAGQGTRFILADTEQLHRKISEMSERIRQLEDAIAIFQAGVSNERHPLLRDELLTIKFGPEVRRTVDEENTRESLSKSIDALGTLTIGDHGETKYFGRSGGSETLFLVNNSSPLEPEVEDIPPLPPVLANLSLTFPLTIVDDGLESILDELESCLPPQPRAWALCEAYIAYFTWWCRPIKRDELIDDILIPIYSSIKDPSRLKSTYHPSISDANRYPHLLAVLYLVLAVGALVDLTLPPCSPEAEKYYRLGRAALSLRSIFDSPEIETVQAVTLMAGYHSLCGQRYTIESAWSLASLAAKLAQSIGLHRDSKQWRLDEKSVQRRRNLFWELFLFELIHCMALGRPPAVQLAHVDCEIPTDEEKSVGENGDPMQGYWHFKMVFSREVYSQVVEVMLSAKSPSYATVLDLDRKIRQMILPPVRLYLRPDEDGYANPELCMKSYLMSHYRCITMISIHRTFFAQALLDNPTNPLSSPYAPSFLAANRCASILLKSFIHHHERCGPLCGRFWSMWTHAFSAAVIVGATVTRIPNSTIAPSALMELELAVDVFQRGATHSLRARQGLPLLLRLKQRATHAYTQYRNKHIMPSGPPRFGPEDQYRDALAIFGGQTRVLPRKSLSRKRPRGLIDTSKSNSKESSPQGTSPSNSTPSDSGSPQPSNAAPISEVHPALMQYLSQIPLTAYSAVDIAQPAVESLALSPAQRQQYMQEPLASIPERGRQDEMEFLNGFLVNSQFKDPMSGFVPDINAQMSTDIFDGTSYSADVVMNDQWTSLMQETGMLDGYGNVAQLNGYTAETFFTQLSQDDSSLHLQANDNPNAG
ncbi:hypothetical protein AcW1_006560 [Taiwanofungus camphoratus]|nr:hypothetical protein AcV5_009146 [Antrodia cinnamomea]KAI0924434.1 hypothetical protein AcW2_005319 [Antrodia cinnamomea]KAI0954772.1 hypothetical protein AcW1_006560 [Antrodia cinnamomea]